MQLASTEKAAIGTQANQIVWTEQHFVKSTTQSMVRDLQAQSVNEGVVHALSLHANVGNYLTFSHRRHTHVQGKV